MALALVALAPCARRTLLRAGRAASYAAKVASGFPNERPAHPWHSVSLAAAGASAAAAALVAAGATQIACCADDGEQIRRLQEALRPLRAGEQEMRDRWIKEEEGWFKLPPRAWPTVQPKAEEIPALKQQMILERCGNMPMSEGCAKLVFDLSSALVFSGSDPPAGLATYRGLASTGHLDAMVAVGVLLVEGLVGEQDEKEGIRWLRKASEAGSAQADYELGTLLYAGQAGLEEDEKAAYACFMRAAEKDHRDGMFMAADCLLEGVGVGRDYAAAVPLLHRAAVKGHRGARQHLRQLLDGRWMGFENAGGAAQIVL
mmetsp:Transcript_177798/g.570141  ORF Transcript_177798/g.570141 Transcript_177798/m.570141 type:complete len:316 (-) Transcript_177798:70-1017(-)